MTELLPRLRGIARAGLLSSARDETDTVGGRSALVLAPHPDDETLGCGATILRKVAAGTPVTVAVVTDGRHSHRSEHLSPDSLAALRRAEMSSAAGRLGLDPDAVRWGGFEDGTLSSQEKDLFAYVAELLAEVRPDDVYTTSADEPHPDHAALGRAVRAAAASSGSRVLEYPVWLWGSWPLRRGDRLGSTLNAAGSIARRRAVKVRAGDHLKSKLHALDAHESQLRRPAGVPDGEPWASLPPGVLAAAGADAELFLLG
ncbi:PIG-L deacetylase family protein [Actinoplanes sp. NPDC051513]|uniref:PIG-L deacetylase family protein n=1 Tax=Actinoplanes sp. NPDC051513 TaxID=3363908 RepID=UPI00378FB333